MLLETVMSCHDSIGSNARRHRFTALCLLAMACAASPAWPASAGFLERAPGGRLDQQDIDALNSTVKAVLNTRDDGETSAWSNHATGNRAEVKATLTPEGTSIVHHRMCRYVVVTVQGGQPFTLRPQYCRNADATWELQGAP